jgi:hypothetical protein
MENTPTKKRKLSSELNPDTNLEEINHLIQTNNFIYSDEEYDNDNNTNTIKTKNFDIEDFLPNNEFTIDKLINQCANSDDESKNPNKKPSNKRDKRDKDKNDKNDNKSSKTEKPVYTEKNNRTTRNDKTNRTDDSSRTYYSNWSSTFKRSRFEPESERDKESDWNDYDKYFNDYINSENISCGNPTCDHTTHEETWYREHTITISSVNTLDDLIYLGSFYHCKMRVEYNGIDMKILYSLKEPLTELNNMIGLGKIKEEIVNTIIYFLLTKNLSKEINSDMMHAVITGSPGCGKTTFIEILAKVYVGLGVLKKGHIIKTRRSELIGKYLGHTAVQTQKKIEEAHGGILLIDEAYALGNPEGRDSFAKECLDTLNQALSEQKTEFICIIAGYKDALESSFFKYNEGLKRRFPFRYEIDKYSSDELSMILLKKIEEYGHYGVHKNSIWKTEFTKKQLQNLIKENYKQFANQGGDMESIFLGAKIAQNKRVFLLEVEEKKKLLLSDIKTSITKFIELHKLNDSQDDYILNTMYV